jgi:hypothetical protein
LSIMRNFEEIDGKIPDIPYTIGFIVVNQLLLCI